jgi:hypothetical protein
MYNINMENLTIIVIAAVFIFLFWGPHNKSKPKDDKKGGDKGKK